MVCCVCKQKEAKVHYSKLDGEKVQKVDLCEDCAKQKGFDDPTGYALVDLLMGIGATEESEASMGGAELRCAKCGFTQADLKKSGRLGCPQCYSTFSEGLDSLLKSMHKGTKHVGKVPVALQQNPDSADRLKQLQKQLAKAIEGENFEQAAALRDEINQIKLRLPGAAAAPAA
jgi:protein arginine kinase activator